MTTKEKRLLKIMLAIFILYIVPFELSPLAIDFYQEQKQEIASLQREIERSRKLFRRTQYWQEQYQKTSQERDRINNSLITGRTRDLITVTFQTLIGDLAKSVGIREHSLQQLPTFTPDNTNTWTLMTQKITFTTSAISLLNFLDSLKTASQKLMVAKLEIETTRQGTLRGTVEIVGFAHLSPEENLKKNI